MKSAGEGTILAYLGTTDDQRAVIAAAGEQRTTFATNADNLIRHAATPRVGAVILDIDLIGPASLASVIETLERRVRPIPVVARFALQPHAIRLALRCEPRCHDLRLSLRGYDDLAACIGRLPVSMIEVGARRAIVARAAVHTPDSVLDIIVAAAVAGERRTSVRDLATLCGLSVRRLEERLLAAKLPNAKRLLMGMLAVHTHWRLARLGWSSKLVADCAGFASGDALARRLKRATGASLDELRRGTAAALADYDDFIGTLVSPRRPVDSASV